MQRIPGSEATHSETWSADDVGDLTGRVALVTGANSGVGYEVTRVLADHGAHVIMACRNREKAARARDKLESQLRRSSLELLDLDLSDLTSVRQAAARVMEQHARLDLLVNNAGVMGTPYRQTADGFELQMATNHLGPFALTGLLLDRLITTERSRVVTVSSNMHRLGRVHPDDVPTVKARSPWLVYSTSKLANLLFVAELSRRLEAGGFRTMALAAHPGWTRSNLAGSGAALSGSRIHRRLGRAAGANLGQSAPGGALPVLCAATASTMRNGQYIGPAGPGQMYGPPRLVRPSRRARDLTMAARLWDASEELTGVRYSVGAVV